MSVSKPPRRVAAIDCGTNTIKLLVAELDSATGTEHELLREARMVRLGQGVDASGRLAGEALERVFAAAEEYAELIARYDVAAVRFCATSAVRDASNADVFSTGIRVRLGVTPEVVAGEVEARLSYDGATRGLAGAAAPVLVVDIGGGSTELVLGDPAAADPVEAACSLDIGSVRLTERLLRHDPPTTDEISAATRTVDAALDDAAAQGVDLARASTVVAVSGTGLTLAAAVLDLPRLDRAAVHRAEVPVAGVAEAAQRLLAMTVEDRRALPYMHPGRADVIAAGGLILARVLARTGATMLTTSVADILDGIAWSLADEQ